MPLVARTEQPWSHKRFRGESPTVSLMERLLSDPHELLDLFASMTMQSTEDLKTKLLAEQQRRAQLPLPPLPSLPPLPPPSPPSTEPTPDWSPPTSFGFALRHPFTLYPHQEQAIRWVLAREAETFHGIQGGLLSLEMGLGKTLIAMAVVRTTLQRTAAATLYICNKPLLVTVTHDIRKFFGDSLRVLLWHREALGPRFFQFTDQTPFRNDIVIVTYDTVVHLAKTPGTLADAFFGAPWTRVIADESHRFSQHKTLVFQAMNRFPRGRRLCLTGTAIRNYADDLMAQLVFCGLTALPKFHQWNVENYERLQLRQAVLTMSIEDSHIHLPTKHHQRLDLTLSERERTIYQRFLNDAADTLRGFKAQQGIKFANVLEKFTRLRQLCVNPALVGALLPEEEQKLDPLGSTKLNELLRLTTHIPAHEKMLVFSQWAEVVELATRKLRSHWGPAAVGMVHGKTRNMESELHQFRTLPERRFLCMSHVGSVGLTLTEANHVVLMEPSWTDVHDLQCEGRVWRIGQTREVFIWQLIISSSVEQRMLDINNEKRDMRELMLENGMDADALERLLS